MKIKLTVNGSRASARADGPITAGASGVEIELVIAGEEWSGLAPVLVARCKGVVMAAVQIDGRLTVPTECCIEGERLDLGVDGRSGDGLIRIPTIWAAVGTVQPGPDYAMGGNVTPPTKALVDQILAKAESAERTAKDVKRRADEGEFDGDPGERGDTGPMPTLEAGSVTTGEPGSAAAVELEETETGYRLNVAIPRGENGEMPALRIGTVTTGEAAASIEKVEDGYVLNLVIPSGGGSARVQSVNGKTGAVKLNASDVGAIDITQLQSAINTALAQAKFSGEFDGAKGDPGEKGEKGDPGETTYIENPYDDTAIRTRLETLEAELLGISALADAISEVVG